MELEAVTHCPVCGSDNLKPSITTKVRDGERFVTGISSISYSVCQNCHLGVQTPRMSEFDLEEYYKSGDYALSLFGTAGVTDSNVWTQGWHGINIKRLLNAWGVKANSALDIGSSTGTILKALGFNGLGVEWSAKFRLWANENGVETVEDVKDVQGEFDLVVLSHVLEHVHRPVEFLRSLKPHVGRWMYIEVPQMSAALPHVISFNELSLVNAVRAAGFEILQKEVTNSCIIPEKQIVVILCERG